LYEGPCTSVEDRGRMPEISRRIDEFAGLASWV
jgi:hypothetical protein